MGSEQTDVYKESQVLTTVSPLFIKINKYTDTIFHQTKMRQKETGNENTDQILSTMMNFAVILDVTRVLMKDSLKQSQQTLLWQLSVAIPIPISILLLTLSLI